MQLYIHAPNGIQTHGQNCSTGREYTAKVARLLILAVCVPNPYKQIHRDTNDAVITGLAVRLYKHENCDGQ